jgi:hypothetical protein
MRVFLSKVDGGVMVQARLEGGDGLLGEAAQLVRPGEAFGQFTHDELVAMGEGEKEITVA